MATFQRIDLLPHIIVQREPDNPRIRPRQPQNRVNPRPDRFLHAQAMKEQTVAATQELEKLRRTFGVDPSRLLVLRLEVLDVNQREALERFGINIVEELVEKQDDSTVFKLLVQFPDEHSLRNFTDEYDQYADESNSRTVLPPGMRRDLYDALDSVSIVSKEERLGRRLRREGAPSTEPFYLDVDIWNPGTESLTDELMVSFRNYLQSRGGSIVRDPLRTHSMILVKVKANLQLLNELIDLDLVSLVDLPPVPLPEDTFDLLQQINIPDPLPKVPQNGPVACIVDSGVLAGHPLLRGTVVSEYDFDSGENTTVDLNGHGTQVGGVIVYGDIARRIQGNEWSPQVNLLSAKVLRNEHNPFDPDNSRAVFPDEERVEEQLKQAIEFIHSEYGCRVFNLSLGHGDRVYYGGRQLPWAELVDELARTLDIVIIVAAGNVSDPVIPDEHNSNLFQVEVSKSLKRPEHKLIDPATSALSVTVGAVARRDDPSALNLGMNLAGSARGCPSPFTRCGPGVAGAIKPELVAPGGNFAVDTIAGSLNWRKNDVNLGEPTLNRNYVSSNLLRAVCGTSISAAVVSHIAARMEASLENQLNERPSQNLIRALLLSSAKVNKNVIESLGDRQSDMLDQVGYGEPNVEYCWSSSNRVSLLTEDVVDYRTFHVYSLVVPEEFLEERGNRSISVSLAYDPPSRLSRQDYIATAMWLEIFGGLTTEQVFEYRSSYQGDGKPPTVPDRNKLNFNPGGQTIRMSTVQKRTWRSNQGTMFLNRPDPSGNASLHIFVGCQPRFPNPLGEDSQRYAMIVTLEHDSQNVDIYNEIRTNLRTRARISSSS